MQAKIRQRKHSVGFIGKACRLLELGHEIKAIPGLSLSRQSISCSTDSCNATSSTCNQRVTCNPVALLQPSEMQGSRIELVTGKVGTLGVHCVECLAAHCFLFSYGFFVTAMNWQSCMLSS